MRKIWYMNLERYQQRYTLQLQEWNENVFKRRGINFEVVEGEIEDTSENINTGSVLDVYGRPEYCLTQMTNLVRKFRKGEISNQDIIFFEDLHTFGIEVIDYIQKQVDEKYRPQIWVKNLAGSTDPDDFLQRKGLVPSMRKFEQMVNTFVTGILVASEEMIPYLRNADITCPIYVCGLAFGKEEVKSRIKEIKPLNKRTQRVAFAARWDDEKNPNFYMNLAKAYHKINPKLEFSVFTGHSSLRGNNQELVDKAYALQDSSKANFRIYENLKKNQYYELLADSRVTFNCAKQDFVSNILSECCTLGGLPLYPAYKSFPEALMDDENFLYSPWSMHHAIEQLKSLLNSIEMNSIKHLLEKTEKIVNWQNGTIDRIIDIFEGKGEQWRRDSLDYRKFSEKNRYEF